MDLFTKPKYFFLITSIVVAHLFFFFFDCKMPTHPIPRKTPIVVHIFDNQLSSQNSLLSNKKTKARSTSSKSSNQFKKDECLPTKIDNLLSQGSPKITTLPTKIVSLEIDQIEETDKPDYFTFLSQTLKEELELPDYGSVKLELTVFSNGKVLALRVLNATSAKNRQYLELTLPQLMLPPFGTEFNNEQDHTFTLTFCNEA